MSLLDEPAVSNLTGNSADDGDDDDDSYVPESLRNFLNEADKKLDSDLADLLAPIRSDEKGSVHKESDIPDVTDPNFEYDQDDDQEDNTIFMSILQQETDDDMKKQLMGALTTGKKEEIGKSPPATAAQEQQQQPTPRDELKLQLELQHELPVQVSPPPSAPKTPSTTTPVPPPVEQTPQQAPSSSQPQQDPTPITDKKDTDDALLEIINPSTDVTESHIKRVAMQGASLPRKNDKKKSGNDEKKQPQATANSDGRGNKGSATKVSSKKEIAVSTQASRAKIAKGTGSRGQTSQHWHPAVHVHVIGNEKT